MEYGFKAYTGKKFTNCQVDQYNVLTAAIDARIEAGMPCEALQNGRHNFFDSCARYSETQNHIFN